MLYLFIMDIYIYGEVLVMPNDNKSRYTEAQKKAIQKYLRESVDEFKIRVPKGQKDIMKKHAAAQGESLNQFVIRAINYQMQIDRDTP